MRERRAEIVADEAITSKVAPEVWGEAMAAMLTELKRGNVRRAAWPPRSSASARSSPSTFRARRTT